ncbi:MAG TPA: flotillin-like FloA family protein, partial [Candidatus Tectomicrobia bacterium]
IDQANADKQIAQVKAEVPRAMAEAFRQGNLGLMDYYRMKNIQADTAR